jgi:hypothetical protein
MTLTVKGLWDHKNKPSQNQIEIQELKLCLKSQSPNPELIGERTITPNHFLEILL